MGGSEVQAAVRSDTDLSLVVAWMLIARHVRPHNRHPRISGLFRVFVT
jgi:hypothetical protein